MPVTLCLTHDCNLRCTYCLAGRKHAAAMSRETAEAAIDFAIAQQLRFGETKDFVLGFFGGEPLLAWERLREADAYAEARCRENGLRLRRTVTTNLTLLTDEKLDWLQARRYKLGLSLDGTAASHDRFRRYPDGRGSHADCLRALERVKRHRIEAEVVCVLNPETVAGLPDSVRFLVSVFGGRIGINPNFLAEWTDADCAALEKAYAEIADFYLESYRRGTPFRVTWIDGKIKTLLSNGYGPCDKCCPLKRELAVSPSGNFYPCENLVGNDDREDIRLGNVRDGLDEAAFVRALQTCGNHDEACRTCPVTSRCLNWCCCVNYLSTGHTDHSGGFLCFHEKLAIRLADRVAETLLAERNERFIKTFTPMVKREPVKSPSVQPTLSDDEKIDVVAERVLKRYLPAFKELAK